MNNLITIYCRTAEEMRNALDEGINQNDIGSVAGVNTCETPMKVWDRKRRGLPYDRDSSVTRMEASLRPLVAALFAEQTGAVIDPASVAPAVKALAEKPWLRVRADRMYWDASTPAGERTPENARLLECVAVRADFEPGEMPSHMYCRLQYKMAVLGKPSVTVAWLNVVNGASGSVDVPFNEGFWKTIEQKADAFWTKCVVGGAPPSLVRTDEDARLRYPREKSGKAVTADRDTLAAVQAYREGLEAETAGRRRKEDAAMRIRTAMGDAEILRDPTGMLIATWKCGKPNDEFDVERFRNENPALYRRYATQKGAPRSLRFRKAEAVPMGA